MYTYGLMYKMEQRKLSSHTFVLTYKNVCVLDKLCAYIPVTTHTYTLAKLYVHLFFLKNNAINSTNQRKYKQTLLYLKSLFHKCGLVSVL